jgi:hypothetical protein
MYSSAKINGTCKLRDIHTSSQPIGQVNAAARRISGSS